ncbi:hypothetical protein KC19_1G333100 [Ceratodon purpureus]|uniref:Uncharacterized protein n=1 Tax=Ceratodon purpureus TaxID=3225 RepID=A0A8T0JF09_CERPU|nr:hypothetical protein KC19_1G333100 [Ceratodon purpureus]
MGHSFRDSLQERPLAPCLAHAVAMLSPCAKGLTLHKHQGLLTSSLGGRKTSSFHPTHSIKPGNFLHSSKEHYHIYGQLLWPTFLHTQAHLGSLSCDVEYSSLLANRSASFEVLFNYSFDVFNYAIEYLFYVFARLRCRKGSTPQSRVYIR